MDVFVLTTIGASTLATVALAGLVAQTASFRRRSRAQAEVADAASASLAEARDELTAVRKSLAQKRTLLSRLDGQLKALSADHETLEEKHESVEADLARARVALGKSETRAVEAGSRLSEVTSRLDRTQAAAKRLESDLGERVARAAAARERVEQQSRQALEKERARRHHAERVLEALDITLSADARDPVGRGVRPDSRALLVDLMTSTASASAALVDHRGLDLLAAGPEGLVRAMGRLAGWADHALPAVEAVLRTPVSEVSAVDADGGVHLHRLGLEDRRWVGVAGPHASPRTALRMTTARLVGDLGRLTVPSTPLSLSGPPPARGEEADRRFVASWASRWKALGVALIDDEDGVIASSDPSWDAQLARAGAVSRGWFRRLALRGQPIQDAELRLVSFAGSHLAIRAVTNAAEGPIAIAVADTALHEDALDELTGAARWNAMARTHTDRPAPDHTDAPTVTR